MTIHGTECEPVGTFPSTGIDVLVVGTGLAGLTAAIECIRKGHNVRVLERAPTINTLGKNLRARSYSISAADNTR